MADDPGEFIDGVLDRRAKGLRGGEKDPAAQVKPAALGSSYGVERLLKGLKQQGVIFEPGMYYYAHDPDNKQSKYLDFMSRPDDVSTRPGIIMFDGHTHEQARVFFSQSINKIVKTPVHQWSVQWDEDEPGILLLSVPDAIISL